MQPFISRDVSLVDNLARDVAEGLSEEPNRKWIKAKYLYDEVGSRLFEKICDQPEYYPFRMETAILKRFGPSIFQFAKDDITLIELGSGNSAKTRILLSSLLKRQKHAFYIPIDVSREILLKTTQNLNREFSRLDTIGIAADYAEGIREASNITSRYKQIPKRKLILFLGSSIGNFEFNEAIDFLVSLRQSMQMGDLLLLGLDLEKDARLLENAYNDRLGITAAFNLNLLSRINRELGGEFTLSNFHHFAYYNTVLQRIEMNLISKMAHSVNVNELGMSFSFSKNERIHTENSYKFTLESINYLVERSGFTVAQNFLDRKKWYSVCLLTVEN